MKKNTYITRTIAAIAMVVVAAACTNDDVEALLNEGGTTKAVDYYTVTVNLETAGTLAEELGNNYNTVEKLVVSGLINAEDAITIRSLPYLEAIDMSRATIVGSSCTYTTSDGYQNTYTLQDNVIGAQMFQELYLSEIILPETITRIDSYAFAYIRGYYSLEVTIPESVESIGDGIFYGCENLVSVKLSSVIQTIPASTFQECSRLSSIQLGENTTSIGSAAFSSCSNLTEIELPSSIKHLGSECFAYTGLVNVVLPNNIEFLSDNACNRIFYDCSSLTSVTLPEQITFIPSEMFSGCSSLNSVTIPNSVTSIHYYAFSRCSSLQSIEIPEGVTEINYGAFSYCSSLTAIKLPDGITNIASGLFASCTSLAEIEIPQSVQTIESEAFSSCQALTGISLSDNIRELPDRVFYGCSSLKSLTLPSRIRSLGMRCFAESGLETIVLPDRLSYIGSECFAYCDNLKTIDIPENVGSVESGIFQDSPNLTSIFWNANIDVPALFYYDYDDYDYRNPNCLLYIANEGIEMGDPYLKNIIRNGVAENITLSLYGHGFDVPQEFLAKSITYTLNFDDYTYPGESYGWQTIALPFTPTSITHEDGRVVAPFNAGVEGAKPFWLRRMTSEGFANVTQLEAGVPYIIAMPNNSAYLDEYNLAGNITFSAEDENGITIPVTQTQVTTDQGPVFSMTSHFGYISSSDEQSDIYQLDGDCFRLMYSEWWNYLGPFQCYATPNSSSTAASFAISSGATTRSARPLGPVPSIDDM